MAGAYTPNSFFKDLATWRAFGWQRGLIPLPAERLAGSYAPDKRSRSAGTASPNFT